MKNSRLTALAWGLTVAALSAAYPAMLAQVIHLVSDPGLNLAALAVFTAALSPILGHMAFRRTPALPRFPA